MSLANEAAYLYSYAKDLLYLNRRITRLSRKAEKYARRHDEATHPGAREKHKKKHSTTADRLRALLKQHNEILTRLKQHHIAFANALQKEHRL